MNENSFCYTPFGKFACGPTTRPTFRIHFCENKYEIAIFPAECVYLSVLQQPLFIVNQPFESAEFPPPMRREK